MRRSIGITSVLIAILVDAGGGVAQPVIQSERQTTPMAVEKRAVGEAGARPVAPSREAMQRAPAMLTWGRRLELANVARQALGLVELRSLTSQEPVLVTPGKTSDTKGPIGLTVFAHNARKFGGPLWAEIPIGSVSPDFSSPSQPYLELHLMGPSALYVISCQAYSLDSAQVTFVFSRLLQSGGLRMETAGDQSGYVHYAFQGSGQDGAIVNLAAYGNPGTWRFHVCTVTRAD